MNLSEMTESQLEEYEMNIDLGIGFATSETMKKELNTEKEKIASIKENKERLRKKVHEALYEAPTEVQPLCALLGGSNLYGLNTENSDEDIRGVFMNVEHSYILGLNRFDELRRQNPATQEDVVLKELNHFIMLLQRGNSEAIEILFADDNQFVFLSPVFRALREHAANLIDSKKYFKCICGYMMGELRLANGERKGKIGGKRWEDVQKYGYSPKNYVQLIRLAWMAANFFETSKVQVNVKKYNPKLHEMLMAIKTTPENFIKEDLNLLVEAWDKRLKKAFDGRDLTFSFKEKVANEFLLKAYSQHLFLKNA